MEKELYHEHLERLYETFGRDTVFITITQAARYCRKDPRTLEACRTFPMRRIGQGKRSRREVTLAGFARWLAG